ncbi:adenosylhomocysteine nucleosidase [Anaerotaenia torta]|uniref:5'-methylthioadenosine/adenosylhomocysteine nucleosidase n=1 Tax=Anaerotaenia torta TaxID=433293 RepID=UPI003D217ECE
MPLIRSSFAREAGMEVVMKKIGIIGAMDEEVHILKSQMQGAAVRTAASMEFCEGSLQGRNVVVVRCGIGKVNAAVCAQLLIDLFQVDAVINTGVAGSLRNEIDIADIVLSSDTQQHDMDATGFGYPAGVIPRMEQSVFPADRRLVELAKQVCLETLPGLGVHVGRIVSGDQFISDQEKKVWLAEQFGGYCTEMEGAAIAQTAFLNRIPFLIIRAISDKADHSAEMSYQEFEELAIRNTVKLLNGLLEKI